MDFEPYIPSAANPWTRDLVSHLARRSGFHAAGAQLAEWHGLGPQAAAAQIVGYPDLDSALHAKRLSRSGNLLDFAGDTEHERVELVRAEWAFRMVHGSHGLRERLVLFWHDLFAVQESKLVHFPMVARHMETLRRVAGLPFGQVLLEVARDPAMLLYLDNRISTKTAPNENWARELMELYSLGLDQYTQKDVVELARIFTGWTSPGNQRESFEFKPDWHDTGDKIFLGEAIQGRSGPEGMQEGLQALEIITRQPACALHLSLNLLKTFADPNPAPQVVESFAHILRSEKLDVRRALQTLFTSAWFYAPERINNLIRTPVELVVFQAKALGIRNPDLAGLHRASRSMGMDLLEPPSVGGWDHGQDWFSPMAAEGRLLWAQRVSALPHSPHPVHGTPAMNFDALWKAGNGKALIESLLAKLSLWDVLRKDLDALHALWLELLERKNEDDWSPSFRRKAARLAVLLVLSLPENCLC
ncbi:MAG: DUF1800 domain-containing protein [Planctomycetes bacterium]|nr:DUF1800 domain-containing protein [Planctomycetota bacterium]